MMKSLKDHGDLFRERNMMDGMFRELCRMADGQFKESIWIGRDIDITDDLRSANLNAKQTIHDAGISELPYGQRYE